MKDFKRFLTAMAALMMGMAGMEAQSGKAVINGRVENYTGKELIYSVNYAAEKMTSVSFDTVEVAADGKFTIGYDVKGESEVLVFTRTETSANADVCCLLIAPGKPLGVSFKYESLPGDSISLSVSFKGENAKKASYKNQCYRLFDAADGFDEEEYLKFPNFKSFESYVDGKFADLRKSLKSIKDKNFVNKAETELLEKSDEVCYAYAVYKEKSGTKMVEDPDFKAYIDAVNPNDTVKWKELANYLVWYGVANPAEYQPLKGEAAQLKHLRDCTQNQNVRNKVAAQVMKVIKFYISFGMNPASLELKDFYEQYLETSTDTAETAFVKEQLAAIAKSAPGNEAVDFLVNDASDKSLHFKDMVGGGAVTYVDFWATWCGPCRAEIPTLAKMVEHFRDNKNVRIISISIDTQVDKWKKMIADDKPAWEQYNIPDPDSSEALKAYVITSIPRFILFDKEGRLYKSDAPRPSESGTVEMIESLAK